MTDPRHEIAETDSMAGWTVGHSYGKAQNTRAAAAATARQTCAELDWTGLGWDCGLGFGMEKNTTDRVVLV